MFVHEFIREWIKDHMENPVERDRRSKEYLLKQKEIAARM